MRRRRRVRRLVRLWGVTRSVAPPLAHALSSLAATVVAGYRAAWSGPRGSR